MDTEEALPERTQSRWPGTVLAILVPGFGHFRAGMFKRGIAWLAGLQLGGIVIVFLLAVDGIPIQIGLGLVGIAMLLQVVLWIDSFRPGRMTTKLWIVFAGLLIAFSVLPHPAHLVARNFKIPTSSMEPTLRGTRDGSAPDHLIADLLAYRSAVPRRGDIIIFSTSDIPGLSRIRYSQSGEIYYIMRVVGLPGETIEIVDGTIIADGRKLGNEDGIPPIEYTNIGPNQSPYEIGNDMYFVLGDNSPNSSDSRIWGTVPRENIIGKATKIYFPFSRMGPIRYPISQEYERTIKTERNSNTASTGTSGRTKRMHNRRATPGNT